MKKIYVLFIILVIFFIAGCSVKEKNEITLEQKYKKQAKQAEELEKQIEQDKEFKQQRALESQRGAEISSVLKKLEISNISVDSIINILDNSKGNKNVGTLTGFAYKFTEGTDLPNYVVVSSFDMKHWAILQRINNGALVYLPNEMKDITFLLEGNIQEIDNQPLCKNYLLKLDGTFTYNTALGSTKTIYKLKILADLTGY